jgi:hypothetical protein
MISLINPTCEHSTDCVVELLRCHLAPSIAKHCKIAAIHRKKNAIRKLVY